MVLPQYPSTDRAHLQVTVEMVVLGCREVKNVPFSLSATPSAPSIQFDLGEPEKRSVTTRSSKLPSGSDPNYCEVLKLRTLVPVDPLFAPRLNVTVLDTSRVMGIMRSSNILGACSVDLSPYLPMWETVAAARPAAPPSPAFVPGIPHVTDDRIETGP